MIHRTPVRRRAIAALAALVAAPIALVLGGVDPASAATTTVACSDDAGDVAAIQTAVNSAGDGDTILLSGTCNFRTVPAVGGSGSATISHGGVLIRPGTGVNGLTIQSAGAPQSAQIVGTGVQAAFVVGPRNRNVTIKGLQFVNLGKAVVVLNDADGAQIGADDGAMPSINGNRILGSAASSSGVSVYASTADGDGNGSTAFGVGYGASGSTASHDFGAQTGHLENVRVAGNYITFNPPGTGDEVNPLSVIGVDVKAHAHRIINGAEIKNNAVGMFTSETPYYAVRGISLTSHCCADSGDPDVLDPSRLPADYTPAQRDKQYFIRNANVITNNLGRFEEIQDALDDIDPALANSAADVQSTGRSGITLLGVGPFLVAGNGVRTLATPTAIPMPAGGIVASDSGYGRINGNGVIQLADESLGDADLGAIGVIDDASALLGDAGHENTTENVLVDANVLGVTNSDPPGAWSRRGFVVNAASRVAVVGNTVEFSSADALNVATRIVGPGNPQNPNVAQTPLPAKVVDSVFCNNTLDGVVDGADEVTYGNVAGNAGNGLPASISATNAGCAVTMASLTDTYLDQDDGLVVTGRAWGNRTATVTLQDENAATLVKTPTTAADGSFAVTYTTAELAGLIDGVLAVKASASSIPTGYTSTTAHSFLVKDTANNPLITGTVNFRGNGDARLNAAELAPLVIQWAAGDPTATKVNSKLLVNGLVPNASCEAQDVPAASGEASPVPACAAAVAAAADGSNITVEISWEDDFGNASGSALVTAVKDATFGATVDITSVTYDTDGDATVVGKVNGTLPEVVGGVFLAVQEGDRLVGLMDGRATSTTTTFNPVTGDFSAVLDTSPMHDGDLLFGGRILDAAGNQAVDSFTSAKNTGELPPVALVEDVIDFLP